jgi:hypothetical protein
MEDPLPLARLARLAAAGTAALGLLLSAAARAGGPAAEASGATPIQVGIGGGASLHNDVDSFRNGYHGRAFVGFPRAGKRTSVRLDLSYQHFQVLFTDTAPFTESLVGGVADLRYDILNAGPARPYLLAGLGWYGVRQSAGSSAGQAGGTGAGLSRDRSCVGLGINGGAGVDLELGRLGVFGEARLESVSGGDIGHGTRVVPITFGLTLRQAIAPPAHHPTAAPARDRVPPPSGQSPFRFGLGGGVSLHSSGTYFKDGYHGRGVVKYRFLDSPVSARLDVTYQHFKAYRWEDSEPEIGVESMVGGALDLQYDLFDLGPARPYVFSGLGGYVHRRNGESAGTRVGFNYGGGVEWKLSALRVFGEIRADYDKKPSQWNWSKIYPITVGILFRP